MATIPWDQTPAYLAASNTAIISGGPTEYAVRRRKGNSQTDVTSFHPGQASWNKGDPPEIFYQLRPTQAWIDFAKSARPGQKLDAAGQPMVEREPPPGKIARPVLAFAVLPDKIGTKEDMFFIELWRRIDGRIRWEDIIMRMERRNRPKANALNMRASRKWRPACGLMAWHCKGITFNRANRRNGVLGQLTQAQIVANTTRGISPGLIDLALGEAGGRIPWPAGTEEDIDDETEDETGDETATPTAQMSNNGTSNGASNDDDSDEGEREESDGEDEEEQENEEGDDEGWDEEEESSNDGNDEKETDEEGSDQVRGYETEEGDMEEEETSSEVSETGSNNDTEPGDDGDDTMLGLEIPIREHGSTSSHSNSASVGRGQGNDLFDGAPDEHLDLTNTSNRPSAPAQNNADRDNHEVAHDAQPSAHNVGLHQLPVSSRYDDPFYDNYPYGTIEVPWLVTPLLRGPPSVPSQTISSQDYVDLDARLLEQPYSPAPPGEGAASLLGKRKRE